MVMVTGVLLNLILIFFIFIFFFFFFWWNPKGGLSFLWILPLIIGGRLFRSFLPESLLRVPEGLPWQARAVLSV